MKYLNKFILIIIMFIAVPNNVMAGGEPDIFYWEPAVYVFEDPNLHKCVIDAHNNLKNYTGKEYITELELIEITTLECGEENKKFEEKIISTKGIEKLVNLTSLNLYQNRITSIDLSNNKELTSIQIGYNMLNGIDLSNNTKLSHIALSGNKLKTINLSKNVELRTLYLHRNQISEIDLSKNVKLNSLQLGLNKITSIDLSKNVNIELLYLSDNNLLTIDLSNNNILKEMDLSNNELSSIIFPTTKKLKKANLVNNRLDESYNKCDSATKCEYGKFINIKIGDKNYIFNLSEKDFSNLKINNNDLNEKSEEKFFANIDQSVIIYILILFNILLFGLFVYNKQKK
ncbi:MAG: hypothetical protein PHR09_01805 [Bacilli bacterium]|nr:hypothetical protein [Bacilli bacterium]